MDLKDALVVVTGGGSGIGRAIALTFWKAGSRVVVLGRDSAKLKRLEEETDTESAIRTFVCDVGDRSAVLDVFERIFANFGIPDILVNNAGVNVPNRDTKSLRPEDWDSMMLVNATGAFRCVYAVLPKMRTRRKGLIVNIVSISGKRVSRLAGVGYCASKFAMAALGLGVGLEEKENGIRVTNIYPGEVNTPILSQRPEPVPPDRLAAMLQPEDIAHMVLAVAQLPDRVCVPEIVITPLYQDYA